MSNYDRIAISDHPDFYFSSNSTTDQSGAGLYGITNSASNVGQPIIVGNPSSWRVSAAESLEFDDNPIFFRTNTQLEVIIQMMQPTEMVCIFGDSTNLNGVFFNQSGAELRVVDSDLVQKNANIPFSKWPEKIHLILTFDNLYCTLTVNGRSAQLKYKTTDPDSLSGLAFKTTSGNTYYLDGLGVYSGKFQAKYSYIDAQPFDYIDFISKTYLATSTLFDGYRGRSKTVVHAHDFKVDPLDVNYYVYTMTVPVGTDETFDSISIESNYLSMTMEYRTNSTPWTSFIGHVSFTPGADIFLIQVRVAVVDMAQPFIIEVCSIFDNTISTNTPAVLTPNGGPLYPDKHTLEMVNFPDGVELYEISYEGQWINYVPNSIEILFMPKSSTKTVIFENADGSVSCGTGGSISGFTSYLNGVVVTDLDDARINQWNHLVLTDAAPTSDTFYLNSNVSRTEENIIEYALLSSYPSVLSSGASLELYSILNSFHKASISETTSNIDEGDLDSGSPFKAYTYAWAIIGGGGT